MPIYEYERTDGACDHCPGRFEARHYMSDTPLTECPRCQKTVRRVFTPVAVNTKTSISVSDLKATGFTRLKRLDQGLYEAEGASEGIINLGSPPPDPESDVPTYDLSDLNRAEPIPPGAADTPEKFVPEMPGHRSRKIIRPALPFYDLTDALPPVQEIFV